MAAPAEEAGNEKGAPPKGGGVPSLLKGRYLIHHDQPVPDLDSPTAKAFHVEDRREQDRSLFALIVPPNIPDRSNRGDSLRKSKLPGLMRPVEWGAVDWPPAKQFCTAIVYERPQGGRVWLPGEKNPEFPDVREMQTVFIEPMVDTVREFHAMSMTHRCIRPDNLFYKDKNKTQVILGDCLTVPPAYDQPVLFETIERGMCQPAGRGIGDTREDLYAIGASLVLLLLGYDPTSRLTDEKLIERKITEGSYATICGNERIPVALLEALRGLLSDDIDEAWGLEDMQVWIDGGRKSPIQRKAVKKADRGFPFCGEEPNNLRSLAEMLANNREQALKAIRDGSLTRWLKRGLDDSDASLLIERAAEDLEAAKTNTQKVEDVTLATVCIQLDPGGPIRYKGRAFMPEGIGPVLAEDILGGESKASIEVLTRGIHKAWFRAQSQPSMFEKRMDNMEKWIKDPAPGLGIERCLYEFNFSLPCQSSLVAGRHVVDLEDLARVLDEVAKEIDLKTPPVDRHIAAFVASRLGSDADPHLIAMGDASPDRAMLGMLSLLAQVQWRAGIESLYGLTKWMGQQVGPALETYNSREIRRGIERDIPKLVRKGSLTELYNRIENPEAREEDIAGFKEAQKEFAAAEEEVIQVQGRAVNRKKMEEATQRVAAVTAVIVTMLLSILIFLSKWQ